MRLPPKSVGFFSVPTSKLIYDMGKSPIKTIGNTSSKWLEFSSQPCLDSCLLGSTMNEERPNPAGDLDVDIPGMDG